MHGTTYVGVHIIGVRITVSDLHTVKDGTKGHSLDIP